MMLMRKAFNVFTKIVAKIIPVRKKRILFTSLGGHYSDSPKYLSEEIHKMAPDLEQIWLVRRQYINDLPGYVKAADIDNLWYLFWYRATARIIIDNVYGGKEAYLYKNRLFSKIVFKFREFLNKKSGQYTYTTWHGTSMKKMGRDVVNHTILDFSCPQTTMILGNQHNVNIMSHLTFGKIKMELLGTPRNAPLFGSESKIEELKDKLGLPKNKKIIMFAPTFRSDDPSGVGNSNVYRSGINQLKEMDFDLLFDKLSKTFGGEWAMVCRFHYHAERLVDWEELHKQHPGKIINGNAFDDMSEYLICTDVLITDASSCMFDFSLKRKPCFLFFPDFEHYQNVERGLYFSMDELPFKTSETFTDLLKHIDEFNEEEYIKNVEKMLVDIGDVDDANSTKRVVEYILSDMQQAKNK